MAWSFAFTAQPGPGKSVCQDSVAVHQEGDRIVIAISDGAGSARHGDIAAALATESALELQDLLWKGEWKEIIGEIQCRLRQIAAGKSLEDFACTLVLASVAENGLRMLQVGDGGGVARTRDELHWLGTPPGEYMNVTTFLHEPKSIARAAFICEDEIPEAICLFSDGLQHLVVDPLSGKIHAPFFGRVFSVPTQPGQDSRASEWLAQMAQSEPVRKRTNDDIGIAVARRFET